MTPVAGRQLAGFRCLWLCILMLCFSPPCAGLAESEPNIDKNVQDNSAVKGDSVDELSEEDRYNYERVVERMKQRARERWGVEPRLGPTKLHFHHPIKKTMNTTRYDCEKCLMVLKGFAKSFADWEGKIDPGEEPRLTNREISSATEETCYKRKSLTELCIQLVKEHGKRNIYTIMKDESSDYRQKLCGHKCSQEQTEELMDKGKFKS